MAAPRIPQPRLLRMLLPQAEQREVLDDLGADLAIAMATDGAWRARSMVLGSAAALRRCSIRRAWWRGRTDLELARRTLCNSGGPAMEQWIMDARHAISPSDPAVATLHAMLAIPDAMAIGIRRQRRRVRNRARDPLRPAPHTRRPNPSQALLVAVRLTQQEFGFVTVRGARARIFAGRAIHIRRRHAGNRRRARAAHSRHRRVIRAGSALIGARPMLGRAFEPKDDVRGAEAVVVIIGYGGLWQQLGGSA